MQAMTPTSAGSTARDAGPELDLLAIGCGPFNLGLCALASTVAGLEVKALDASRELRWHPGLMLDDAVLQVGFLADLVTLVEPTHPLSFLAYLKDRDRLYPFYVRERFHMTRREYEDYLRWAAARLPSVRFSCRVEAVRYNQDAERFVVSASTPEGARTYHARHLVLGIGTEPALPAALDELDASRLVHTSAYLPRRDELLRAGRVTVVGSGQSGAEVVLDLLRSGQPGAPHISWLTRAPAFAPLDYTKLVLEMTTPAYIAYFHGLSEERRDALVRDQWRHYKGISTQTLEEIHDLLYGRLVQHGATGVELRFGVAVGGACREGPALRLDCTHRDTGRRFSHSTDMLVAATGYRHRSPAFLEPIDALLRRDAKGRLSVRLDHSLDTDDAIRGQIFVSNADLHSHGVAAPDLGISAYRNATILNAVMGRAVYELPRHTAFTSFAPPAQTLPASSSAGLPCTRELEASTP
jgi:lysine N6-hydroxylase